MGGIGAELGDRLAKWLNKRHPFVSALTGALIFAGAGGVAGVFVARMLQTRLSELLPWVVAGIAVGAAGTLLWGFAFSKGFDVPLRVGRAVFVLTLVWVAACLFALVTPPPLQVFCAAVVAARLLPQTIFAVLQGLQNMRDPAGRTGRVRRATTMAFRSRPLPGAQSQRE
jgi:hypothetical protein